MILSSSVLTNCLPDFTGHTSATNESLPTKACACLTPLSTAGISEKIVSVATGSCHLGTFNAGFLLFRGIFIGKTKTYKDILLFISQVLMNGIHPYWIINTLKTMGEPDWATDPNENFQFGPKFDEFCDCVNRSLSILDILDETPSISPIHNILVNKHVFQHTPVDYEKLRPYLGWVN